MDRLKRLQKDKLLTASLQHRAKVVRLFERGDGGRIRWRLACDRRRLVEVSDRDRRAFGRATRDSQLVEVERRLWECLVSMRLVLLNVLCRPECQACRAKTRKPLDSMDSKLRSQLTSFVLRFGVERDELEPEREGGRSFALLSLLEPAFSPFLSPFRPMLSRSRDSEWSPLARGDGEPWNESRQSKKFGKQRVQRFFLNYSWKVNFHFRAENCDTQMMKVKWWRKRTKVSTKNIKTWESEQNEWN